MSIIRKIFSQDSYNFFCVDITLNNLLKKKLHTLNKHKKVEITSDTCHVSNEGHTNYSSMQGKYYHTDCKHIESYFYELIKPSAQIKEISMRTSSPHSIIHPHRDALSESDRKTCLTWALTPEYSKCAPTLFYNDIGDEIYKHYYDENAFVLDTRIIHSMKNNEDERTLLQITFDCELEQIWASQ